MVDYLTFHSDTSKQITIIENIVHNPYSTYLFWYTLHEKLNMTENPHIDVYRKKWITMCFALVHYHTLMVFI
jgi:hypothetical protein